MELKVYTFFVLLNSAAEFRVTATPQGPEPEVLLNPKPETVNPKN